MANKRYENEFIDFLRDNAALRTNMTTLLKADSVHVYAYYLVPLSTLRQICIDGGIRCRDDGVTAVDLSSSEIQLKRKTVFLGRTGSGSSIVWKPKCRVHTCVNTFLNPVNRTFEAFQRNALLAASKSQNAEDGVLCILELDLERILHESGVFWAITNRNMASNPFESMQIADFKDSSKFDWPKIFDVPLTRAQNQNTKRFRAAECILFDGSKTDGRTAPLSLQYVSAVLLSKDAEVETDLLADLRDKGLKIRYISQVFKSRTELLHAELKFVDNIERLKNTIDVLTVFRGTIDWLLQCERTIGSPRSDWFEIEKVAHGVHGTGHIARVMFWSAFLSIQDDQTSQNAIMLAALIHDLCRSTDDIDELHGESAAERYKELVEKHLSGRERVSCLKAVEWHCRDDQKCPEKYKGRVWVILKDADALDRGRFSPPDKQGGCDTALLRTPLGRKLTWLAYRLAQMTRYTPWNDQPCMRLLEAIRFGLNAARNEEPRESHRKIIDEMVSVLGKSKGTGYFMNGPSVGRGGGAWFPDRDAWPHA